MAILKLATGKDAAISGVIESITAVEGKFGPQAKIEFVNGDQLYLNVEHVDRQLKRLGKSYEEMTGETVTIWKKPMDTDPTKGFLNIDLGAPRGGVSLADTARNDDVVGRDLRAAGLPVKRATSFDEVVDKYTECLGRAHAVVSDYNDTFASEAPDRALPPEVVTSVAATLLIERTKQGV